MCQDQYKVYVSFAEFHIRHLILSKLVPMEAVTSAANYAQGIRDGHAKAKQDAQKLAASAAQLGDVSKVRELLSQVKACAASTSTDAGTTEQAHSLKTAPQGTVWTDAFKEGTPVVPHSAFS